MQVPRKVMALAGCTNTAKRGYELGGVRFNRSPGGSAQAVACNGRGLAAVMWEDAGPGESPEEFSVIVPAGSCRKAAELASPTKRQQEDEERLASVCIDESTAPGKILISAEGKDGGESATYETLDGKFPRWRDTLPQYRKPVSVDVDPYELIKLLQALAPAADTNLVGYNACIRLTFETAPRDGAIPEQPGEVAVTVSTGHLPDQLTSIGVVMPVWDKKQKEYQAGTAQPEPWK